MDSGYIDNSSFGWALGQLRIGHRVARAGWNGKGMWLALRPGSDGPVAVGAETAKVLGQSEVNFLPHIVMKTVRGDFVPWLASQTDILADDWETV